MTAALKSTDGLPDQENTCSCWHISSSTKCKLLLCSFLLKNVSHDFIVTASPNIWICTYELLLMNCCLALNYHHCTKNEVSCFLRICLHLLQKSLMENFIFCAVHTMKKSRVCIGELFHSQIHLFDRTTLIVSAACGWIFWIIGNVFRVLWNICRETFFKNNESLFSSIIDISPGPTYISIFSL